ncbi:histidine kinase [Amycolatopsis sp. NBC_00348]|uniref:sensor histidine kinase n=1 Tax=Amycolatopsis sp. NBC_00348 TaxID=2975956 RepID=UPI002E255988
MLRTWLGDRLRRLRDGWRVYNAEAWDPWLTVLAFTPVLGSMSAQFGDLPRRPADAFAIVLVLAQTVPLAVRARQPALCLAIVGTSFAVHETLAYPPEFGTVTTYFALYAVGAHQERFRRGIGVAASVVFLGLSTAMHVLGSPNSPADVLIFYFIFVACWLLGAFVRRRRVEEAERRRLAVASAATAERARIARELHDVVTHHVTAIVVQADATQFVAGSQDRVRTALTTIGRSGRRALTELRHLLDVLEATGEPDSLCAPADGTVTNLVKQTRAGGQPVSFVTEGTEPILPDDVRLTAFRVVQEGLTNVLKYAAGRPAEVRIGFSPNHVEIEVANTAATVPRRANARREPAGGRGLAGLRDRVGALGGEVTAGRRPDGGFRLHASIPVDGEA